MSKYKNNTSKETILEAEKVAKSTQKSGQTKEQTKLIAQGIQKGIEQYKKQHKAKSRELNKKLKSVKKSHPTDNVKEESINTNQSKNNTRLPWLLLALSWGGFIFYSIQNS